MDNETIHLDVLERLHGLYQFILSNNEVALADYVFEVQGCLHLPTSCDFIRMNEVCVWPLYWTFHHIEERGRIIEC